MPPQLKNMSHKLGDVLPYTNDTGATITAGTPVQIGTITGILPSDLADGDTGNATVKGTFKGHKITGAMTEGNLLYWDATGDPLNGTSGTGAVTETATEVLLGEIIADAASGDEQVTYKLDADVAEGAGSKKGLVEKVTEGTVEFTADAAQDLPIDIPAGAVITGVSINLDTLIVGATAVKVGIGVTADEDKYGKTTGFTKNLKSTVIPAHAVLSSAEDIQIFAVDTGGDDAGTLTSGTVQFRVTYTELIALDDVA